MMPTPLMEWICHRHWRLVSRRNKARLRHAKLRRDLAMRSLEAFSDLSEASVTAGLRAVWGQRLYAEIWRRCKAEAIERAAGVTA